VQSNVANQIDFVTFLSISRCPIFDESLQFVQGFQNSEAVPAEWEVGGWHPCTMHPLARASESGFLEFLQSSPDTLSADILGYSFLVVQQLLKDRMQSNHYLCVSFHLVRSKTS
jgi:hypothetical protein